MISVGSRLTLADGNISPDPKGVIWCAKFRFEGGSMFNRFSRLLALVMCAVLSIALAEAQDTAKKAAGDKSAQNKAGTPATAKSDAPEPFIGTPDKIKWVQFAPGIEYGPVHGNCDKAGAPCVFQLRFAPGGKIPAHWHPGVA